MEMIQKVSKGDFLFDSPYGFQSTMRDRHEIHEMSKALPSMA